MKVSVTSWTWVTAWSMLTASPIVSPASNIGAEIISISMMACCPMWITYCGVMDSIRVTGTIAVTGAVPAPGQRRCLSPDSYLKLVTIDSTMRCQPSTRTKSRILKGSDTVTGGSIIMPIESSVLDTTMSMMINGMKRMNPI